MSLQAKIINQRIEIYTLNERCRAYATKIKAIRDLDYYKYRLQAISPNTPYKILLTRSEFKQSIEDIFKRPFDECLDYYKKLLDYRNEIVHKYTQAHWKSKPNRGQKYQRRYTKKSLNELVKDYHF